MKVLHTSDWHVGKKLGRHDRMDEHAAAIGRVVAIAGERQADLVLHSGDLFDRALPPVDALRTALEGLVALADGGRRPVVAVAGNHDSGDLFEALAPLLQGFGVHLVGRIKSPDDGGILTVETAGGIAHVACFPFLRAAQTVDFMERAERWYGLYAERVRGITEVYAEALAGRAGPDDVTFLTAHFMVGGVKVRRGEARGERDLHIGDAYAAAGQAVPTALDYVALGHIHAPQPVPGAQVPAEYAGSLLQLDFGEAGEQKRVVLVDARPGVPATIESLPLDAGIRLERVAGTWDDITARTDLDDAYLDLVVDTTGPEPELMDLARDRFSRVVKVQARYERPESEGEVAADRPLGDLYAEYLESEGESDVDERSRLADLFAELEEEAAGATG